MASARSSVKKEEPDEDARSLSRLSPRARRTKQRSWTAAIFNLGARIAVWYAIAMCLFFCPSTPDQLDASHPAVCKPYLHSKLALTPYVRPYYDTYAATYVDIARPYAQQVNDKVIGPSYSLAKSSYDRFGAPRVAQVVQLSQEEWERRVKPQIDAAQALAEEKYEASLGPYVHQAQGAVGPYYTKAKDTALHQYQASILPAYKVAAPYAQAAYARGYTLTTTIVFPYLQKSGMVAYGVLSRRVWPPIRILYGENVQPQLAKIRERLANYRDGKAIESAMDQASSPSPPVDEGPASLSSPSAVTTSDDSASSSSVAAEENKPTERAEARSLGSELTAWKGRFARASDKGIEDLKAHVAKVTAEQVESQVKGTGAAHITSLEETVSSGLESLKNKINSIVESLPEEETDEDEELAIQNGHASIRVAGQNIKKAAQKVRVWKAGYTDTTQNMVRDATDHTLDVIEHIRELSLQEVGMRYASQEDASHEEWKEYHGLKKTPGTWQDAVERAGMEHEELATAKQAGDDIEAQGMAIAEDAAMELARLKDVVVWKVRAKDATDDFSTKTIPKVVRQAKELVEEKLSQASEAVRGTAEAETASSLTEGVVAGASSLADDASSTLAAAVEHLTSATESSATEDLSAKLSRSADDAASSASLATAEISDSATSISKAAASVVESAADAAAEAHSSVSSFGSEGVESASSAAASVSSAVSSSASAASESALSVTESIQSEASHVAEAAVENAAAALSSVQDKVVRHSGADDDEDKESLVDDATSSASSASSRASDFSSSLSDSASSIVSDASFGTLAPSASSVGSAASDYIHDGGEAASSSVSSAVREAGSKYTDATSSLASSAGF